MTSPSQRGWDPAHTWVFIVGLLEWADARSLPPFPQEQRRDGGLAQLFMDLGVPESQLVYLKDGAATTAAIQDAFEAQLAATRAGDLQVVYFAGHGGKDDNGKAYFASYNTFIDDDPGWRVDTIPRTIERHFGGDRVLLLADCCYSGSLAKAFKKADGRHDYACLASSLASELSTGNWTFTEGVMAGLQGQAFVDADSDHWITLEELARQMGENMAFAEGQLATFAVGGGFDPHMLVAPARPRPDPRVGARVEVQSGSQWYRAQVIDVRGAELQVHYFGYPATDDEWITAERRRSAVPVIFNIGSAVEVRWKQSWYPATVLDVHEGVHHIHYDGYGSDWDEWVAPKRIRSVGDGEK